MANFRRAYPRTRTRSKRGGRHNRSTYFMKSWPAWWDIVFHRRPPRRIANRIARGILIGQLDADTVAWPLSKNGHRYYW